jgi:hypothetical protein
MGVKEVAHGQHLPLAARTAQNVRQNAESPGFKVGNTIMKVLRPR